MITTKKQLFENLKPYAPNEKIFVMFWTKDEFEGDEPITTKAWDTALESMETLGNEDSAEQEIAELITECLEEARKE
jgi:hypothetical protein